MIRSRQGVALLTSLAILVVVAGIAALMFSRTLAEIRHSGDDSGIVQSLLLARGAANLAGAIMQGPVRTALDTIVDTQGSAVNPWAFGSGSGAAPDAASVVTALSTGTPNVANSLQAQINTLICGVSVPGLSANESVSLRIHVTNAPACGQPIPAGINVPTGRFVQGTPRSGSGGENAQQTYALPFVIVAEGRSGEYSRSIVTSGEYHFLIGRGSFAQYALFTNVHRTAVSGGQAIWFTENTLFDGPVHTNQHFRFYRDPWFGGQVSSAGCDNPGTTTCTGGNFSRGAFFYDGSNNGSFVSSATMPNPTAPTVSNGFGLHAPEFSGGVGWTSPYIPLPANNQNQRNAAQSGGLYFNRNLSHLIVRATDASMVDIPPPGNATPSAFQVIEACWTQRYPDSSGQPTRMVCQVNRINAANVVQRQTIIYNGSTRGGGVYERIPANAANWATAGTFNGAVFVDGTVSGFTGPARTTASDPATASPALASFAQFTVAADGQINIAGDLKYQSPPCTGTPTRTGATVTPAVCDNLGADNILGIYSQNGDIRITAAAQDDLNLHAVMMTSTGVVGVNNFDSGNPRGTIHLLGGIIENAYGAFGTFNANTGARTGYGRAFTFDRRTGMGMAPPFFPTVGNDDVINTVVFSFGQREQLE